MEDEYAFSNAERGRFYRPDAQLNILVYLDQVVVSWVAEKAKSVGLQFLVNDLLRKNIALIEEITGEG